MHIVTLLGGPRESLVGVPEVKDVDARRKCIKYVQNCKTEDRENVYVCTRTFRNAIPNLKTIFLVAELWRFIPLYWT
jgi:hypothetical protein